MGELTNQVQDVLQNGNGTIHAHETSTPKGLCAADLVLNKTASPKPIPAMDSPDVKARRASTDHMITVSWSLDKGWATPQLVPYGPLSLLPSASGLQYGTQCFEGMKVYRGYDGKLRLFRPLMNCRRMLASARRVSLPDFEPSQLLELIKRICAVEAPRWLPRASTGQFLYIRPSMIADYQNLAAAVPESAILCIFLIYWPAFTPEQRAGAPPPPLALKPQLPAMRLLASREHEVRAWPNGTGAAKIGGNYGPTFPAHAAAVRQGYDQVLWLLGKEGRVTEAGATNVFAIWRTREGGLQIVTPGIGDGVILHGITRQSILDLSRERFSGSGKVEGTNGVLPGGDAAEPLEVLESDFTILDLIDAEREGRLLSFFAVGTALFVNPVSAISYREREIAIDTEAVPHVRLLQTWLMDIMYGKEASEWTVEVDEE